MRGRARIDPWRHGVTGAGILLLLALRPESGSGAWGLVATLTLLAAAAEAVPLGTVYRVLYPSFSPAFAAFLILGPGVAAWVAGGAAAAGSLLARRASPETVLERGAVAVAGAAAGWAVFRLAGGGTAPMANWLALSLYSPTFLVVSILLLLGPRLRSREELLRLGPSVAAHFVLTAFGLLLAAAVILQGAFALLLVAVALAAVIHLMYQHEQLHLANLELRTLQETARRLGAALRLEEVFAAAADAAQRALGARTVALFLADEGALPETPVRTAGDALSPEHLAAWHRLAAQAGAGGEGVLLPAGRAGRAGGGAPGWSGSFAAVPLRADGQWLGVLAAGHPAPGRFRLRHLRLLGILGSQVAAALRSALLYEQVENLAVTDGLTGLYNHRYLQMRLNDELQRARAQGGRLAVVYLDLDRFKGCNDAYGHLCGDHILAEFAHVLRDTVRQSDVVARYGGDEFVLLLPGAGRAEALETLRRVQEAVRAHPFTVPGRNVLVRLGVSAGVACFPEDGDTADALLSAADRAMYVEKDEGTHAQGG